MEKDFLKTIIESTGLPEELIFQELSSLASQCGQDLCKLSLDDLRKLLAQYLRRELLKAKRTYS